MGKKTAAEKKQKKEGWFKGIRNEFGKISWPNKESITKQTFAVVVITIILGVVIHYLDYFIDLGLKVFLG